MLAEPVSQPGYRFFDFVFVFHMTRQRHLYNHKHTGNTCSPPPLPPGLLASLVCTASWETQDGLIISWVENNIIPCYTKSISWLFENYTCNGSHWWPELNPFCGSAAHHCLPTVALSIMEDHLCLPPKPLHDAQLQAHNVVCVKVINVLLLAHPKRWPLPGQRPS